MLAGWFVLAVIPQCWTASLLEREMKRFKLIPDIIYQAPLDVCQVEFPSGVKMDCGNKLSRNQIKHQPRVTWKTKISNHSFYSLYMTGRYAWYMDDIRDDKHLKISQLQHWVVTNIPNTSIEQGIVVYPYYDPSFMAKFLRITCVIAIFEMPHRLDLSIPGLREKLPKFTLANMNEFGDKAHFGRAVAGNFFRLVDESQITSDEKDSEDLDDFYANHFPDRYI